MNTHRETEIILQDGTELAYTDTNIYIKGTDGAEQYVDNNLQEELQELEAIIKEKMEIIQSKLVQVA